LEFMWAWRDPYTYTKGAETTREQARLAVPVLKCLMERYKSNSLRVCGTWRIYNPLSLRSSLIKTVTVEAEIFCARLLLLFVQYIR
jgi:hypothetical protein